MKTAIALKEGNENSCIDRHFGRCAFFCIFDDETGLSEIRENPGLGSRECKGEIIVRKLLEWKVSRVISGDFGIHVQQSLTRHRIQMIIHPDEIMKVGDIISLISQKKNNAAIT
jgi:predicted Fe-Mo cluster-binding NifX family protein